MFAIAFWKNLSVFACAWNKGYASPDEKSWSNNSCQDLFDWSLLEKPVISGNTAALWTTLKKNPKWRATYGIGASCEYAMKEK